MTTRRHTNNTVCHWDLEPNERIGTIANSLLVNQLNTIVIHPAVGARSGSLHGKHRQRGYYDSENYSPNIHDGLPDKGARN
jgi:hypothetical protein